MKSAAANYALGLLRQLHKADRNFAVAQLIEVQARIAAAMRPRREMDAFQADALLAVQRLLADLEISPTASPRSPRIALDLEETIRAVEIWEKS